MGENEIRYKSYLIRECSYKLRAGGWVPRAVVFEPTKSGMKEHPPLPPPENMIFSTRQQAGEHALDMAKSFVNQRLAEGR